MRSKAAWLMETSSQSRTQMALERRRCWWERTESSPTVSPRETSVAAPEKGARPPPARWLLLVEAAEMKRA